MGQRRVEISCAELWIDLGEINLLLALLTISLNSTSNPSLFPNLLPLILQHIP